MNVTLVLTNLMLKIGDLDGTHTIYSKWKDAEVVFHVTSLIDVS